MTTRDDAVAGLTEVLAGHGEWRWDMGEYEGDRRAQCVCGEVLTEGTYATLRAHQATLVLAHLEAQGWGELAKAWDEGHGAAVQWATRAIHTTNPYRFPVETGEKE